VPECIPLHPMDDTHACEGYSLVNKPFDQTVEENYTAELLHKSTT